MSIVTVDSESRVFLPRDIREELKIKPGDELVVDRVGKKVMLRPWEVFVLARAKQARREYRAGKTIPLRELVEQYGVDLNVVDDDLVIH